MQSRAPLAASFILHALFLSVLGFVGSTEVREVGGKWVSVVLAGPRGARAIAEPAYPAFRRPAAHAPIDHALREAAGSAPGAKGSPEENAGPRGGPAPRFLEELRAAIDREKEYPAAARSRRQTGTVAVAFILKKSGEIEGVRLAKPSGFARLDEAGLATVLKLRKFKPVPDELSLGDWNLTIPINFVLN
jgi:TonB family protein